MKTEEITTTNSNSISLKNETFGSPISEKLSDYLRKYTTSNDRATVCIETGVGMSTVRDVCYRKNSLTEDNSKAIIALVNIAISACENSIEKADEAIKDLKEILTEKAVA